MLERRRSLFTNPCLLLPLTALFWRFFSKHLTRAQGIGGVISLCGVLIFAGIWRGHEEVIQG